MRPGTQPRGSVIRGLQGCGMRAFAQVCSVLARFADPTCGHKLCMPLATSKAIFRPGRVKKFLRGNKNVIVAIVFSIIPA